MAIIILLVILVGLLIVLASLPAPGSGDRPRGIKLEPAGVSELAPMHGHARIVLHCPDGSTRSLDPNGECISLGRSSANDVSYPEDASLSRQHLVFEKTGEDCTVRDLGSKNGTRVNGVRLAEKHVLRPGDRITAGHLLIVYDYSFHRTAA